MKINSSARDGLHSLTFSAFGILLGLSFSVASWAGPTVQQILDSKQIEFAKTQERLYQEFVEYVLNRYCPKEYAAAKLEIGKGYPEPHLMDALIDMLQGREPELMDILETCANQNSSLRIFDEFVLHVPEFFNTETLILAKLKLIDPDGPENLEERIPDVDKVIQDDIAKDYTSEKLFDRLKALAKLDFEEPVVVVAAKKKGKRVCTFEGCTHKVSSPDMNLGYCKACNGNFCGNHRYLFAHKCPGEKADIAKKIKKIEEENPVIVADKVPDRI